MSQQINDNFKLNAGKPLEFKYFNSYNEPYNSVAEANSLIPIPERHVGLTVNINSIEYWYKNGVLDTDLIEKKYDTLVASSDYVTGATNVGYFSGFNGIQTLPITHLTNSNYTGSYKSMYNYYYRGTDGIIHVGTPSDGIAKRGYLKTGTLTKSWVWNEYTGGTDMLGWTLIDGDISTLIGTFQNSGVPQYYNGISKFPYTNTSFISGSVYSNSSNLAIGTVTGSLTTGTTISIGGRVYKDKTENKLNLKTIISTTPNLINVYDDESFIRISGGTVSYNVLNTNVGGSGVYKNTCNNTFYFKRLIASGSTSLIEEDNRIVICGDGGINTGYNCYSPTSVSVGGILSNTNISGKNTFELFENILSPVLNPELSNPFTSVDVIVEGHEGEHTFEIGYNLDNATVVTCLNRGCINPKYNAVCDKRSGAPYDYVYSGNIINGIFCNTMDAYDIRDISGYEIIEGEQSIDTCVCYLSGPQPYNNRGVVYNTPLPLGITPKSSVVLCGILPWYWGISDSPNVDGRCVSSYGYCGVGGKCVEEVKNNTICVDFQPHQLNDPKYLWFAIPNCAENRSRWFVSENNCGNIGAVSDLFSSAYVCKVDSYEGYWTECDYKIYVSHYPTEMNNKIMYIN